MRLVCPSCAAQYEVPDDAIPEEGRDVQCGTCGTVWFQEHPDSEQVTEEPAPQEAVTTEPEPSPAPRQETAPEPMQEAAQIDELFEGDEEFSDEDFGSHRRRAAAEPVEEPAAAEHVHSAAQVEPEHEPAEQRTTEYPEERAEPEESRPADLDFSFDYEDDDAAPAGTAPSGPSEPVTPRFDKSLHSKPPGDLSGRPSWVREPVSEPSPTEEPEDLQTPTGIAPDDEEDLLKTVREELGKLEEAPEEEKRPELTRKARGVESAAAVTGIVIDDEEETEPASISDLEQSLAPQDLEDLSAPAAKPGSGNFSVGFAFAVVLFALGYATYTLGPKLASTYPPAAPYLVSYSNAINETRRVVEEFSSQVFGFAEDKLHENSDGS